MPRRSSRINIRQTHPSLYWEILAVGLIQIQLGLVFFFGHPAFNPFGISKFAPAAVFFVLGTVLLVLLNIRDLVSLRRLVVVSIGLTFAWGIGNSEQFWNGKASLQLPIMFSEVFVAWQIAITFRLMAASTIARRRP